jgi:glycosyltransferase involved in cell wall biosynthesis
MPDVGVVIPARNAAATLGAQLEALCAQRFDGTFEVGVVVNRCTDDSRMVTERFAGRLGLSVIDADFVGGVIVDDIGTFTVAAARTVGDQWRVVSFEADPITHRLLEEDLRCHRVDGPSDARCCTVVSYAGPTPCWW